MINDTGYVYFIADEDLTFCKIGYSTQPERRLQRAQTDCPLKLKILRKFPGSLYQEKKIQQEFGTRWVRGEWYKLDYELIDRIFALDSIPTC